jgi:hypothetical protein
VRTPIWGIGSEIKLTIVGAPRMHRTSSDKLKPADTSRVKKTLTSESKPLTTKSSNDF